MPEGEVRRLIQRRPHGQRNAAQRQQRPGITDNSDLTPGLRWALGISLCVLFISMGLVFYVGDLVEMKKYALNFYDYQEDESIQTPGRILQKLVEDSDRLITVERSVCKIYSYFAQYAKFIQSYLAVARNGGYPGTGGPCEAEISTRSRPCYKFDNVSRQIREDGEIS